MTLTTKPDNGNEPDYPATTQEWLILWIVGLPLGWVVFWLISKLTFILAIALGDY